MSKKNNLYLGKAGELTAMSYFLMRGWNVATPEVDVGDDIFVIEDNKGIFHRVQVKTAKAVERKNGYSVQFNLPLAQLEKRIQPEIHYIFVVCRNEEWSDKIIIPRRTLFVLHQKLFTPLRVEVVKQRPIYPNHETQLSNQNKN